MSAYLKLPQPAQHEPTPWLALVATPLVIATGTLAHAVIIVLVTTLAVALVHGIERVTRSASVEIRNCIVLVAGAGIVTCADLLLLAFAFPVYRSLAFLAPAVLAAVFVHRTASAEAPGRSSTHHGELMIALLLLGIARELVGHGSLLHDFGAPVAIKLFPPEMGFFLAALAPGAFIAVGLLLALLNWLRRPKTEP